MLGPILFVVELVVLAWLSAAVLLVLSRAWRWKRRELALAVIAVAVTGLFISVSHAMGESSAWSATFACAAAAFALGLLALRVLPPLIAARVARARREAGISEARSGGRVFAVRWLTVSVLFVLGLSVITCATLLSHVDYTIDALRAEAGALIERTRAEESQTVDATPVYSALVDGLDASAVDAASREAAGGAPLPGAAARSLLDGNPRLIERVRDAARRPSSRVSGDERSIEVCWNLLDSHARLAVDRGDTRSALEDVVAAVSMSEQLCAYSSRGREAFRLGAERMARTVETLAWILAHERFDVAGTRDVALTPGADLPALYSRASIVPQAAAVHEIAEFGDRVRRELGLRVFVRFAVPHEALIFDSVNAGYHPAVRSGVAELVEFTRHTLERLPASFIASEVSRRFLRDHEQLARTVALRRLVAVALAVETFRDRSGRPPSVLLDLVPEYFPVAPEDPVTRRPIRLELRDGVCMLSTGGFEALGEKGEGYAGESMSFRVAR